MELMKMDVTRPIRYMIVEKVGLIDLDGLYKIMQHWFYENHYYFEEPTSRVRPGSAAGIEYEFDWRCWRKVNDYVLANIFVFFHVLDAKEVEVIKEGQKVKLTKCRIRIEFRGDITLDYTHRFSKSKLGHFLFWFYNKYILKEEKQVAHWWDELYYRVYKLQTIAKEYLDMESKGNAYYDEW